jgi:hypothetical protein
LDTQQAIQHEYHKSAGKAFPFVLFSLAAVAFAEDPAIHVATYFDVVVTDRWPLACSPLRAKLNRLGSVPM